MVNGQKLHIPNKNKINKSTTTKNTQTIGFDYAVKTNN